MTINGDFLGLYLMWEIVDEDWAARRFPSVGMLYKLNLYTTAYVSEHEVALNRGLGGSEGG